MHCLRVFPLLGTAILAAAAVSQDTPQEIAGKVKDRVAGADVAPVNAPGLHLESNVGSFKIKRGSEALNEGTLDINFTGTVSIDELTGEVKPGPGVKLDYAPIDMPKQVFHGKGRLHVTGKFGTILFFGRDMHALYTGTGVLNLYGEFDKNLETGNYWYGADPSIRFWGTGGATITPNPPIAGTRPNIRVRDVTGKG